ncbi:hypothetical protein PAHAL_6G198400 [Panicum hallii]|uniref:Uncharacterized protein n=1 Tax=Panicum hallii TaxID=206008 RepID=A0A2T8IGX3_9POAL|nr:hypothetical protein PAHAL_6G198400 [Panicum hallii]
MAVVAVGGQQYSQGSVNSGTPSQEKSGMASARKRSQCDPAGISQTIFLFFIIIGYWMKKGTENGLGKQKIGAALNDIGLLGASIISGFVLPKLLRKLNVTGGRCGSCDSLIQQTIQVSVSGRARRYWSSCLTCSDKMATTGSMLLFPGILI